MLTLKWTPGARAELLEIVAHIAAERPQAARTMAAKIKDAVLVLPRLPDIGRMVQEFGDPSLSERIVRPYRVVCLRTDDAVVILAVVHSRRLLSVVDTEDDAGRDAFLGDIRRMGHEGDPQGHPRAEA